MAVEKINQGQGFSRSQYSILASGNPPELIYFFTVAKRCGQNCPLLCHASSTYTRTPSSAFRALGNFVFAPFAGKALIVVSSIQNRRKPCKKIILFVYT